MTWGSEIEIGGGGGSGSIETPTEDGQMLFGDTTSGEWKYTETDELVWDDDNKNLGIGVAAPTSTLHIVSPAVGGFEEPLQIQIADGGASFMKIRNNSSANGEFSPEFWGYNDTNTGYGLSFQGTIAPSADTGNTPIVGILARYAFPYNNIQTRPIFAIGNSQNLISSLRILANGDTGINTNTPFRKLDIHDDLGPQIRLSYNGSVYCEIETANNGLIITKTDNGYTKIEGVITLVDDETYTIGNNIAGFGKVMATNQSTKVSEGYGQIRFDSATIVRELSDNFEAADSDGKLCVYLSTGDLILKNRTGLTCDIVINFKFI